MSCTMQVEELAMLPEGRQLLAITEQYATVSVQTASTDQVVAFSDIMAQSIDSGAFSVCPCPPCHQWPLLQMMTGQAVNFTMPYPVTQYINGSLHAGILA